MEQDKDYVVLYRETFDMVTQEHCRCFTEGEAIREANELYCSNPQTSDIWVTRISDGMDTDLYRVG